MLFRKNNPSDNDIVLSVLGMDMLIELDMLKSAAADLMRGDTTFTMRQGKAMRVFLELSLLRDIADKAMSVIQAEVASQGLDKINPDAVFESASGYTATVVVDENKRPQYRVYDTRVDFGKLNDKN